LILVVTVFWDPIYTNFLVGQISGNRINVTANYPNIDGKLGNNDYDPSSSYNAVYTIMDSQTLRIVHPMVSGGGTVTYMWEKEY
jgi:hypothetical protein